MGAHDDWMRFAERQEARGRRSATIAWLVLFGLLSLASLVAYADGARLVLAYVTGAWSAVLVVLLTRLWAAHRRPPEVR